MDRERRASEGGAVNWPALDGAERDKEEMPQASERRRAVGGNGIARRRVWRRAGKSSQARGLT